MRIHIGSELIFEFAQPTPVIALLAVHASRVSDLESPDVLVVTPSVPVEGYRDGFGNWCARFLAPAGLGSLRTQTIVRDAGPGELKRFVVTAEEVAGSATTG